MDSREIESHASNSDESGEFVHDAEFAAAYEFDPKSVEDPIVTIDRKQSVQGSFIAITVLSLVVLAGSVTLFGDRALRDFDVFMILLFGITIAFACAIISIWIRARWICVAVLDESGVIASTMERKYDLPWGELVGARTYTKVPKDAKKVQARVLLLLEDGRCLEAPIDQTQMNQMVRIAFSAEFKPGSEGQRLGLLKGLTLAVLGTIAILLGIWWAGHVIDQFNNGTLFKGNIKVAIIKLALAIAGPVGGIACIGWGLYHAIARPILYEPGYLSSHE